MLLKNLRFRNILGYGNYFTEIDLTKNTLTIVIGENGSGKTSLLLDTICFALFNRLFRDIKKKQYINSITKKELEVQLTFVIGEDEYIIIRGQKPDRFEILKNGILIPQDSTTGAYQDKLETIIGMNFKTFSQIVVLGDKYVPFLSLPAGDRRKIVENILDLEVFSVMNIKAKAESSDIVEDIRKLLGERMILEERIKNTSENIKKNFENNQKLVDVFLEKIKEIENQIFINENNMNVGSTTLLTEEDYEKYSNGIKKYQKNIEDFHFKLGQLQLKKNQIKEEIKFWNELGDCCPNCTQTVSKEFSSNKLLYLREDMQKCDETRPIILGQTDLISTKLIEWSDIITEHNATVNQIGLIEVNTRRLVSEKNDLTKKMNSFIEQDKDNIDYSLVLKDLEIDMSNLNDTLNLKYKERDILSTIIDYLKDDGFKAQFIKGYIDRINELMNEFLMKMDFFCEFYFDEDFNETIKSRYRDEFSYQSFSAGQKLRIDLAILSAWRELAKRRNSISVNLLIFDEVLSSALDTNGVVDLVEILKKANMAENSFVITHSETYMNLIENSITIEMIKGFSRANFEKY